MRVLAIGIHPDDVEISCGGTVATLCARGDEVVVLDLTRGESSTNGTPEARAREAEAAARILGVARRINAALPDAGVRFDDLAQRRAVVTAIRSVRPHLVLIPNPDDAHPDHAAGGVLSQHAVFMADVDGYVTEEGGVRQARWRVARSLLYSGRKEVRPDIIVDITAAHETKMQSIRAHATQVGTGKDQLPTPLTDPRFFAAIEARDRVAGRRVGATFGEAFQLLAPLGLADFTPLIKPEA
jgi:N-acetylglucosamine malate deacetylase 1